MGDDKHDDLHELLTSLSLEKFEELSKRCNQWVKDALAKGAEESAIASKSMGRRPVGRRRVVVVRPSDAGVSSLERAIIDVVMKADRVLLTETFPELAELCEQLKEAHRQNPVAVKRAMRSARAAIHKDAK